VEKSGQGRKPTTESLKESFNIRCPASRQQGDSGLLDTAFLAPYDALAANWVGYVSCIVWAAMLMPAQRPRQSLVNQQM
jgi:hypothetical protein